MDTMIEKKYVVLDVETNGLSSLKDDLLSISIYKPDDEKMYDRLLPLELNCDVYTTNINGITKNDLKKAKPLTQTEVNEIIKDFELDTRTILTYGNIDEKFIKNYFKRKKITGYELMTFYNFKHDIISSSFSEGNITKDNLCNIYGIDNVIDVHNGANDCLLEWQLFKKMNGNKLLITNNNVFELNEDYIIPASYLSTYPNFKYCFNNFPNLDYTITEKKKFNIQTSKIKKFDTNISGMTIEHLINTLLKVKIVDSSKFLLENKRKLKYIGKLPSIYNEILVKFNNDGTVSAINDKDKKIVKDINSVIKELEKYIQPLIKYIKESIFNNEEILSQELVISDNNRVLALCDLSNSKSILEIKTYSLKMEKMKYQLYYESNKRKCYVMNMDWSKMPKKLSFIISEIEFSIKEKTKSKKTSKKEYKSNIYTKSEYKENMKCNYLDIVEFGGMLENFVKLECQKCHKTIETTYLFGLRIKECPFCRKIEKEKIKNEKIIENKNNRFNKFRQKILDKSNNSIDVLNYLGAKEKAEVICLKCNYKWNIRADHLIERCYCPNCKNKK